MSRLATICRTRAESASASPERGRDVHAQLLVLLGDPRTHQLGDLADGLADVDRPALDLDVVGLDPRDVEQVVDEVDQPVGGAQDDLDELALAVGHLLRRAVRAARRTP